MRERLQRTGAASLVFLLLAGLASAAEPRSNGVAVVRPPGKSSLEAGGLAKPAGAALRPADGRIFFVGRRGNEARQIFSVGPAGEGLLALTSSARDKRRPALAPGGQRLVYSTNRGELWSLELASRAESLLLSSAPGEMWDQPAFSPSGEELLAVRIRMRPEEDSDLYRLSGRGAPMPWFAMPGMEQEPAFSPDGRSVICAHFEGRKDGIVSESLWLLQGATGLARKVLDDGADNHHPVWLDAGHVVFVTNAAGNPDLRKLDLESGVATSLTTGLDAEVEPAVSTGGRQLAFVSLRESRSLLCVMTVSSGETRVLELGLEEARNPLWGAASLTKRDR